MPYVKEKMKPADKKKIKKNYDSCSDVVKQKMSAKLSRLNDIYEAFKNEADPKKQSMILLKGLNGYVADMKEAVKKAKLQVNQAKGKEESQEALLRLDNELLKI